MLVLDEGTLVHFSCGQRMGIVFLGAILMQAVMLASMSFRASHSDHLQIELLEQEPIFTRRRMIAFAIWSFIVGSMAVLCMFCRTETLLTMDSRFIVETSCIGPFEGEYRLDRTKSAVRLDQPADTLPAYLTILFTRHRSYNSKQKSYLELSQPGADRALYIDLAGRENAIVLKDLAPQAMQDYAIYLRNGRQ